MQRIVYSLAHRPQPARCARPNQISFIDSFIHLIGRGLKLRLVGCALFLLPVFPAHRSSANNLMLFNLGWARSGFLSAVELSHFIVCFFTVWQGSGNGPSQLCCSSLLARLDSWSGDRRRDYDGQAVLVEPHLSKRNAPIRPLGQHFDLASTEHAFQGPLSRP